MELVSDVWGFDENAIQALKKMEPPVKLKTIPKEYEILLNSNSLLLTHRADDIQIKVSDLRPMLIVASVLTANLAFSMYFLL